MRKAMCALALLAALAAGLSARDIQTDTGASMVITTRTTFGVNLDAPNAFGLKTEFPGSASISTWPPGSKYPIE